MEPLDEVWFSVWHRVFRYTDYTTPHSRTWESVYWHCRARFDNPFTNKDK